MYAPIWLPAPELLRGTHEDNRVTPAGLDLRLDRHGHRGALLSTGGLLAWH